MGDYGDTFVSAWKAVSIIMTGGFGILGLVKDFRDKATSKISIAGKISLAGIVISTILGTAAQIYDTRGADSKYKQEQEKLKSIVEKTLENTEKTETAIQEIRRSSLVIDEQASFKVVFTIDCTEKSCAILQNSLTSAKGPSAVGQVYIYIMDREQTELAIILKEIGCPVSGHNDIKAVLFCDYKVDNLVGTQMTSLSDINKKNVVMTISNNDLKITPTMVAIRLRNGAAAAFFSEHNSKQGENRFTIRSLDKSSSEVKKQAEDAASKMHETLKQLNEGRAHP